MVQREVDPLTGARRDDVLISEEDLGGCDSATAPSAPALGDAARSAAACKPRRSSPAISRSTGPRATRLLSASRIDPDSMEPDYNAVVTLEAVPPPAAGTP